MTTDDSITYTCRALSAIAAAATIVSFGQFLAIIGYGGPVAENVGRIIVLLLPPALIWFVAPKLVKKLYVGEREMTIGTYKSILILCVGVSLLMVVVSELFSFMAAWYTYSNNMLNYGSSLVIKGSGVVLLLIISTIIINKHKTLKSL